MKIVIASDSYKGSNTSMKVASLIEEGASRVFPEAEFVKVPVADGGEGTFDALLSGLDGKRITVNVEDPLGRPMKASYGVIGNRAIIEMASASGLTLLENHERNPLKASSYGTGQLLMAALEAGYTDITIGIGGSATNDGGSGMARALGYRFLDSEGKELPHGGEALKNLAMVDDSHVTSLVKSAEIHVACDVDNPLLGLNGASHIYGPQKGATPEMITILDEALTVFADVTESWKERSVRNISGTGAAGGMGFGLTIFCDALMESGIETILNYVDFDLKLEGAHLVITGEGKIDGQSIRGKVPMGVAQRAASHRIPVLAIAGDIGEGSSKLYQHGIDSIMSTVDRAMPLSEAIERSKPCLISAAERACRMIQIGMKISGDTL